MLKYKQVTVPDTAAGKEELTDILAGMSGKNRHIVSISTTGENGDNLRLYRDAEQIVDCDCELLTDAAPWLTMDLPLAEGQQVKVGLYTVTAESGKHIVIGYTEAG